MSKDRNDLTDNELVASSLERPDDFLHIVRRYEEPLRRYIRRLSAVSAEEVDDILQDVFLKVYLNLNDFDGKLKFSSWLYRITHNQVISAWRRRQTRREVPDSIDNFLDNLAAPSDLTAELDTELAKEKLNEALAGLEYKYREVLILKFWEGKDYREIGDILKKPLGTVATLINRAKKQLARLLDKNKLK